MTEPEKSFAISGKDRRKALNKSAELLKEPKEEPANPLSSSENESVIHQFNKHNHKLFDKSLATPPCIICKIYPSTLYGYTFHLRRYHYTTLKLNGIYLLCSCGAEVFDSSRDPNHTKECAGIEFTFHRLCDKNDFDISYVNVKDVTPSTPKCILCEKHPSTVYGYVLHLYNAHKSSLIKNRIFLRCSCGSVVYSTPDPSHSEWCFGDNFSLQEKKPAQCILCEECPSTAYTYCQHLETKHQTSLNENRIYLRCSCGHQIHSRRLSSLHSTCTPRHFSIERDHPMTHDHCYSLLPTDFSDRKVNKIIPSTPQCILCEKYPTTLNAYVSHIYKQHQSSLIKNGIFLRCACGSDVYGDYDSSHGKRCSGIFSVQIKKPTPQCILCEKCPSTAYNYGQHLEIDHHTSLNAKRIYLRCSCGYQIRSPHRTTIHGLKCEARQFTIETDHPMNHDHCYSLPSD